MKRGASPIKTKILSEFMQKFTTTTKKDEPLTQPTAQSIHQSKSTRQKVLTRSEGQSESVKKSNQVRGSNEREKSGFERSVDEMLGFGSQPVVRSRYVGNNSHSSGSTSRQQSQVVSKKQTVSVVVRNQENAITSNSSASKANDQQHQLQQYQVQQQLLSPLTPPHPISHQSSCDSIQVNSSPVQQPLNPPQKFIPPLSTSTSKNKQPMLSLNSRTTKPLISNPSPLKQSQPQMEQPSSFQVMLKKREEELRVRGEEMENLVKEKVFFVEKVQKLEQDLSRKEKELTRRTSEINSSTLERQVVVGFLSNLADKLELFLNPQEDIIEVAQLKNQSTSKSLHKTKKPPTSRSSSSSSTTRSLSLSTSLPTNSPLQSISQTKEITLIESINTNLLNDLTKSMQKGLSRSEVAKNAEKVVSGLKRFIGELKKSEEGLVGGLKGEYQRLEKEFEGQKVAIAKVQKSLQAERAKVESITQKHSLLSETLNTIQIEHSSCTINQKKLTKQLQTIKQALTRSKQDLTEKTTKLSQLQQKVNTYERLPNQFDQERQSIRRSYQAKMREKQVQIQTLKKTHQKQLTTRQSQHSTLTRSHQQLTHKITTLQQTILQHESKISSLQTTLTQKQLQLKHKSTEGLSLQQTITRLQKEQEKVNMKLQEKVKRIENLEGMLLVKEKKVFQVEFTVGRVNEELQRLREESKVLEVRQVKWVQTQSQLRQQIAKLQQQKSITTQQLKRYKSTSQRTQQQLLTQIKHTKQQQLTLTKQLHTLQQHQQTHLAQILHLTTTNTTLQQTLYQLQTKLTTKENSITSQTLRAQESQALFSELTGIHCERQNSLMVEKERVWREELKAMEERSIKQREELWREREVVGRLKEENERLNKENVETAGKLSAMHQGVDMVSKRLSLVFAPIITKPTSPPTSPHPHHPSHNPPTEQLIYQQNPSLSTQLRTLRQQSKKLHEVMGHVVEIQVKMERQQKELELMKKVNEKLVAVVEQVGKEVGWVEEMGRQVGRLVGQVGQVGDKGGDGKLLVEEVGGDVLWGRLEVLRGWLMAARTSTSANDTSRPSFLQNFITQLTRNQQPSSQSPIQQPTQQQSLLHKISISQTLTSITTCLIDFTYRLVQSIKVQHQKKIKQIQRSFVEQRQAMERELVEARKLVMSKEAQYQQGITKSITQLYQPTIQRLQQQNLHLSNQHQSHIQTLTLTHQQQLTHLTYLTSLLQLQLTHLQHQLSFLHQQQTRTQHQLQQTRRQLEQQKLMKNKVSEGLNRVKIQVHQLKQYELRKWQERCAQLQIQLTRKSQLLAKAYHATLDSPWNDADLNETSLNT